MTWLFLCMANNLDLNIYNFAASSGIRSFCHALNKNNQWKIMPPIKYQSNWMLNSLTADTAVFLHRSSNTRPKLINTEQSTLSCATTWISVSAPVFVTLSLFWMLDQLSRPGAKGQWSLLNRLTRGDTTCLWIHSVKNTQCTFTEN